MRLFYEIKPLQATEHPYLDAEALGRVLVAGHEPGRGTLGTLLGRGDDRLGVLDRPRPRDDRQDQAMLGVVGDVVPPVPFVNVGGVGRVAVLLLLTDEGPLL